MGKLQVVRRRWWRGGRIGGVQFSDVLETFGLDHYFGYETSSSSAGKGGFADRMHGDFAATVAVVAAVLKWRGGAGISTVFCGRSMISCG